MFDYKKALIRILNAQGNIVEDVPVLFNPSEYTIEKENEFASIGVPGLESPFLQFTRGGLETMTMELFFDTYEDKEDVRDYTDRITDLLMKDREINAPPILMFVWGKLNFTCVLKRASRKFTMFMPDGTPVRATLNVTFQRYRTEKDDAQSSLRSSDKTKIYSISEGDALWSLAARFYGNPGLWRMIALKNNISDPMKLPAGTKLTIPPVK